MFVFHCFRIQHNNTTETERMRQNMIVEEEDLRSPVISALENEGRIHLLRRDEVSGEEITHKHTHTLH